MIRWLESQYLEHLKIGKLYLTPKQAQVEEQYEWLVFWKNLYRQSCHIASQELVYSDDILVENEWETEPKDSQA